MLTLYIDAVEASSLLHTMTSPVVGMEVVIAPAYYRITPSRVQSGIGAKPVGRSDLGEDPPHRSLRFRTDTFDER